MAVEQQRPSQPRIPRIEGTSALDPRVATADPTTPAIEAGGGITQIYPTREVSVPRRRAGVTTKTVLAATAAALGLGAGGAALAWQMFTGSDRGPQTPPAEPNKASDTFKPPSEGGQPDVVGIVPNPTQESKPAVETQKPPEVKAEPAPCLITSPELCAQAERIQIKRSRVTETYVTLNPVKKTPFWVAEDGRLLDKIEESGDPFSGLSATLYKPNPPGGAYIIIGLEFDDMLQVKDPKKGSLIGYSTEKETTNFGAKVLVTITKRTPGGPVTDEEALKELFPAAYQKPIKATYTPEGPGKPNVSISYDSTPPQ